MSRMKKMFSAEELKIPSFYRDIFIELFISAFLLMFITFALTTMNSAIYSPNTTHIGIMVGFVVFLIIEGYGHFSGAHMNPVVTFAFCIDGRITLIRAVSYTVVQCIGGTLGSCVVYGLSPEEVREGFRPFMPSPSIGILGGLVVEIIFTFNLVFVALSASDQSTHVAAMPAFPTGFCVGTAILAVGSWTGACLNPIVALGPAVISRNFTHHWVYWAACYLGALAAVLLYTVFKMARTTPKYGPDNGETRETEALRGVNARKDITKLVDQIIQLTSQHEDNANLYSSTFKLNGNEKQSSAHA